jgi:hypothetical protein
VAGYNISVYDYLIHITEIIVKSGKHEGDGQEFLCMSFLLRRHGVKIETEGGRVDEQG